MPDIIVLEDFFWINSFFLAFLNSNWLTQLSCPSSNFSLSWLIQSVFTWLLTDLLCLTGLPLNSWNCTVPNCTELNQTEFYGQTHEPTSWYCTHYTDSQLTDSFPIFLLNSFSFLCYSWELDIHYLWQIFLWFDTLSAPQLDITEIKGVH